MSVFCEDCESYTCQHVAEENGFPILLKLAPASPPPDAGARECYVCFGADGKPYGVTDVPRFTYVRMIEASNSSKTSSSSQPDARDRTLPTHEILSRADDLLAVAAAVAIDGSDEPKIRNRYIRLASAIMAHSFPTAPDAGAQAQGEAASLLEHLKESEWWARELAAQLKIALDQWNMWYEDHCDGSDSLCEAENAEADRYRWALEKLEKYREVTKYISPFDREPIQEGDARYYRPAHQKPTEPPRECWVVWEDGRLIHSTMKEPPEEEKKNFARFGLKWIRMVEAKGTNETADE